MNHSEHTMPRAGRTSDRMTTDAGWAGWKYSRSRVWDWVFTATVSACASIGAFLYLAR